MRAKTATDGMDAMPKATSPTETATSFFNARRNQIIRLYENLMYGRMPGRPQSISFHLKREKQDAFCGRGTRKEISISMENDGKHHAVNALCYLPNNRQERVPCIAGLSFCSNAGCSNEEDIPLDLDVESRGCQSHRWQIPMLLDAGYAVAIAPRNAFFLDEENGRATSIYSLFHPESHLTPSDRDLTAISAWAFGYMALLELAQTEPRIDPRQIWAHGHSRLGKTALWAAANDLRFAGVVSNDSGCCGAALFRGKQGERVSDITSTFPWWFTKELDRFADKEDELPLDQHFLLSLIAPRPLLVASASEDLWADPKSEFNAVQMASETYKLFGSKGMPSLEPPKADSSAFGDHIGYYLREGKHDVTEKDWAFVLEFIKTVRGQGCSR